MEPLLVPLSPFASATTGGRVSTGAAAPFAGSVGLALDPALQALLWQAFTQTFERVRMAAGAPTLAPPDRPDPMPLSARECEVLARVAAGDSNKHIARALDLSVHTVKRHVANILDKLDARSRWQAAAWWLARG